MVPIIANESVQRGRTSIKHCMFLPTVPKKEVYAGAEGAQVLL